MPTVRWEIKEEWRYLFLRLIQCLCRHPWAGCWSHNSYFVFLGNFVFIPQWLWWFTFTPIVCKVLHSSAPSLTIIIFCLFINTHSYWHQVISHYGQICVYLTFRDIEPFVLSYFLADYTSSLKKKSILIHIYSKLGTWTSDLFILSWTFWLLTPYKMAILQVFSPNLWVISLLYWLIFLSRSLWV